MIQDALSFLPLRVTRVVVGGKRSFDPVNRRRLVKACLQPGASLSGLALKAGVNANELRKWVQPYQQASAPVESGATGTPCAFVPVVAIDDRTAMPATIPAVRPALGDASQQSSRPATAIRLATPAKRRKTEAGVHRRRYPLAGRTGCCTGNALMFRFEADLNVFLHREPIDFRAGINNLVTLVEQSMLLDPFERAVFAFHNRRRNRVKLLFYERAGFWLMLRRLEQDHFAWPRRQQTVVELTTEQLHWLLDGIDIDAVRRHPPRRYRHAS